MSLGKITSQVNTAPSATLSISLDPLNPIPGSIVAIEVQNISGFHYRETGLPAEDDRSFKEIYWTHYITAPAGEVTTYSVTEGIPNGLNDRLIRFGRDITYIPLTYGVYGIRTIGIHPNGQMVEINDSFTIQQESTVFNASNTVVYDPLGTGNGASSSNHIYTDFTDAVNQAKSLHQSGAVKLMLKRGTVNTNNSGQWITNQENSIKICDFGSGEKPVVNSVSSLDNGGISHRNTTHIIQNIKFVGGWSTVTETGTRNDCFRSNLFNSVRQSFLGCEISGFSTLLNQINTNIPTESNYTHVEDCVLTGWANYGLFFTSRGKTGHLTVLATSIVLGDDAASGPCRKFRNDHGPVRLPDPLFYYFCHCTLHSRNGWTADRLTGLPQFQGVLRLTQAPSGIALGYIGYNNLQGNISYDYQDDSQTRYADNLLVEGNFSSGSINIAKTGAELRNNVFKSVTIDESKHAGATLDVTSSSFLVYIEYLTTLDLTDGSSNSGVNIVKKFTNVKIAEDTNIVYSPNKDTPSITYPLSRDTLAFQGRESRAKMNIEPVVVSGTETVGPGEDFTPVQIPSTGVDGLSFNASMIDLVAPSDGAGSHIIIDPSGLAWNENLMVVNTDATSLPTSISVNSSNNTVTFSNDSDQTVTLNNPIFYLDRTSNPTDYIGEALPADQFYYWKPSQTQKTFFGYRPIKDAKGNKRTGYEVGALDN